MSARKTAVKKATGAQAAARTTERAAARTAASKSSSSTTSKRPAAAKDPAKEPTRTARASTSAPKAAQAKKTSTKQTSTKKASTTGAGTTKPNGTKKAPSGPAVTKRAASAKKTTAPKQPPSKQAATKVPTAATGTKPAATKATTKRAAKATERTSSTKKAAVTKNSNGGANHRTTGPSRSAASAATDNDVQRLTHSLKVKEDETPWTAAELREIGTFLREEIASYEREIEQAERELVALLHTTGDGAGDDQADAGARTFEREHEIALANNSRDMLAQTERALDRLTAGTYGVCENCGSPIGKGRLQVFPRATLCMTCKTKQERH